MEMDFGYRNRQRLQGFNQVGNGLYAHFGKGDQGTSVYLFLIITPDWMLCEVKKGSE